VRFTECRLVSFTACMTQASRCSVRAVALYIKRNLDVCVVLYCDFFASVAWFLYIQPAWPLNIPYLADKLPLSMKAIQLIG